MKKKKQKNKKTNKTKLEPRIQTLTPQTQTQNRPPQTTQSSEKP